MSVDQSPRARLDPELAALLAGMPALCRPLHPDDIPRMRAAQARLGDSVPDADLTRGGVVVVDEQTVPGIERPLLVLRPAHATRPLAGVLYLHGGGMVAGDARTGLRQVLDWVVDHGVVVASLDYRLAPEHPHPTPVEDCYAGLRHVDEHSTDLGVDRWFLAGASAGGGLAAGASLMALDRNGPDVAGLLLFGPMLDDRNDTPSSREIGDDVPWGRGSNVTGWHALLGKARGGPTVSPYAAPARADDLSGLPPTYLDVGGVEVFRDEVVDFGQRLAAAGVPVELHVWAGAFHGFDVLAPDSALARAAREVRAGYLSRMLRPSSS